MPLENTSPGRLSRAVRLHRSHVSLIVSEWKTAAQFRDDIPANVRYEMPAIVSMLDTRRAAHQREYSNYLTIDAPLSAWIALGEFCALVGGDGLLAVGREVAAGIHDAEKNSV